MRQGAIMSRSTESHRRTRWCLQVELVVLLVLGEGSGQMEDLREEQDTHAVLNQANQEFNSKHYKRAEDLYTEFINICLTSG